MVDFNKNQYSVIDKIMIVKYIYDKELIKIITNVNNPKII